MGTRIAVLADTHLPDSPHSAQDAALEWALTTLRQWRPSVVVLAGDVTADGSLVAAKRARLRLEQSGLPFRCLPGNSDLRSPSEACRVCEVLTATEPFSLDGWTLLPLDTSTPALHPSERQRLQATLRAGEKVIVVSHMGRAALCAQDRAWLEQLLCNGTLGLWIAGHHHLDREEAIGPGVYHVVRGLDPEKAIGGPPAFALFEWQDGVWQRTDVAWKEGDVGDWREEERTEFIANLGGCGMADPVGFLDWACRQRVTVAELRIGPEGRLPEGVPDAVARWRAAGGTYLSVHLPNLVWDAERGCVEGQETCQAAIASAMKLGVQALTVHVPRASVGHLREGGPAREAMCETYARLLTPAVSQGVVVSVENLRLRPGQPLDDRRPFGCLPEECLEWVHVLRQALRGAHIGFHLDVGHARNNVPFSSRVTLSEWFVHTGQEITGYHLHQVVRQETGLQNHRTITSVFGPLISFSAFFWAWRRGQIRHAPMFLEISQAGGVAQSFETFRRHLWPAPLPPTL